MCCLSLRILEASKLVCDRGNIDIGSITAIIARPPTQTDSDEVPDAACTYVDRYEHVQVKAILGFYDGIGGRYE